jgi:Predicted enzyme of the cupin superfamily
MDSAKAEHVVDRVDAEDYEPDIIDGTQVGEFHQIEPTGDSADKLDACLWRSDPATYDYLFEGDEAFHVLEGAATVELPDTGEKVELRAGDVAYFAAGTRSIWTITKPFKKFTVIAN